MRHRVDSVFRNAALDRMSRQSLNRAVFRPASRQDTFAYCQIDFFDPMRQARCCIGVLRQNQYAGGIPIQPVDRPEGAACIFFLCWNHTVHVWTVLENISVAYLIFVLFLNVPLALSGSSASDTTKRDFWLEYTSAKKQLEQLQLDNSTNSKEFKKQVLRVQNAAYQYYRWRYSQRGEEFSQSAETEIQFVMQFFQMVDKDHSFVKKSMFFVPVEIYVLDFESAVEKKQLESALHILNFFIQKIGDVHDWNTEIGRNDLRELNDNCSVWFDLADKAEDFVNANDDMRQQLRSVYDDACISLMTAPKSLKQKAKQRKDLLK